MRFISVFVYICLLFTGCADSRDASASPTTTSVLIDPGHGGFDAGAIGIEGTYEKHLNLAISLTLRDMLQVCGVSVRLTRDTDRALNADNTNSTRSNKTSDMRARLALYQQAEVVLSIHQNKFEIPKYFGTQIFYSGNHPDSQELATSIQTSVRELLQADNHREIKKATDGIYLLHHTTVPCALVECGFLSNPNECEQLKDTGYQQKLAFAISTGYWKYNSMK